MEDKLIIQNLMKEVPELQNFKFLSGVLTIDFDSLGAYINHLAVEVYEKKSNEKEEIIARIFGFINRLFNPNNKDIYNLISVSIFELIPTTKHGYKIAKKYMSEDMYRHFLREYPYEKNKDSWDTSDYYSEEEYQRILDLPDVDDNE